MQFFCLFDSIRHMEKKKLETYDHNPLEDSINTAYTQSKNDLVNLPQSTLVPEGDLHGNIPNIFRVNPDDHPNIWIKNSQPELYLKVAKADVGGVGGHVTVSLRTKATVLQHILKYNRWNKKPIFRSVFVTNTGDDVCITGVIDQETMNHHGVVDELLWDAFMKGGRVAEEEGLYGPYQDMKADAFTGNLHGAGPASIVLPLPHRKTNMSQTVLLATADKTEPGAYNHLTTGAYLLPRFNTGLAIAQSAMKNGYIFEILDLDTKAQSIESGVSPQNKKGLDEKMDELGKTERFLYLSGPEDLYDISALTMNSSRYVISRIFTKIERGKPGELDVVVSAQRLHNIKTEKGFVYGGKDDPIMASLCQADFPAPGEIVSPLVNVPIVAGDCRGSHNLHLYPVPINSQTSYWSGPIISIVTLSINLATGHIGAIADQFAKGTPWDGVREEAGKHMIEFRNALGHIQPGTLPTGEMEYQTGYNERIEKMNKNFKRRKPQYH